MNRHDAITTEVIRHALETIAEEMRTALRRTATSVVVKDMLDYSCALFDRDGRLLATAIDIPSLLATMAPALQAIIERFGDAIFPGDVLITNHPYLGSAHTSDVNLFVPVFDGAGVLIGFSGTIAHHADWGGRVPGTAAADNRSVFEEGVLIPAVKIEERGEPNRAVTDIILANVRNPNQNLGDLQAQLAAARTGERRLARLAERYTTDVLLETTRRLIDYSARRTRQAVADMRDGVYSADGCIDDNGITPGEPVRLAVTVTVAGEHITFDFSDTDPQMPGALNIPAATTRSAVHYALKCFLPSDIPFNEGSLAPVEIVAPLGCAVNPEFPTAVSDRHLTSQRLADVLVRALAPVDPARASAGWFVGWPVFVLESASPKTREPAVLLANVAGGAGATADHDGADALDVHLANCALIPAEVIETSYELRVERYALIAGSGGRGRHRGGLGIRADYRVLGTEERKFLCEAEQADPRLAPPGAEGGEPGAVARLERERDGTVERLPTKGQYVALPGDVIRLYAGGGGGFGDASGRDPAAALKDRESGRTSA